jgi:lipopolysaccharide/colanic/teichoic acid biosynthesis glycosyltransferase
MKTLGVRRSVMILSIDFVISLIALKVSSLLIPAGFISADARSLWMLAAPIAVPLLMLMMDFYNGESKNPHETRIGILVACLTGIIPYVVFVGFDKWIFALSFGLFAFISLLFCRSVVHFLLRDKRLETIVVNKAEVAVTDESIRHVNSPPNGPDNKVLYIKPEVVDILVSSARLDKHEDKPYLVVGPLGLSISQSIIKRSVDLVLAVIGSLPLIIVTPIIAIYNLFGSPGPLLYAQERIGLNGKPFMLLKFRTMIPNAEQAVGPVLALDDDPRITKIGKFLRATRLDELPQIINIIKGEMSIVGPRPERDHFIGKFKENIPGYELRLMVKPGLTGLAQVKSKYNTAPQDKLIFDMQYICHYSLWLDLKIIVQTVCVLLTPDAARGVEEIQGTNLVYPLKINRK